MKGRSLRILITGCTSQHISTSAHERIPTFAGLLHDSLREAGEIVVWSEPSMEMDRKFVSMFDKVIVGLVSPTSIAANRIYAALSVAEHAWSHGNLVLLADSPEPHRLWSGITSSYSNYDSLAKDFYARRKDYIAATEQKTYARILEFLGALTHSEWPETIFPELPWSVRDVVERGIPNLPSSKAIGLSFDRRIELPPPKTLTPIEDTGLWSADSDTSAWVTKTAATLALPVAPVKVGRLDDLTSLEGRLRGSVGTLISTYRGGSAWWTPLIAISLLSSTPVVTDWRLTSPLGDEWSHLPSTVETLDTSSRIRLAETQYKSYMEHTPSGDAELERLFNALSLTPKKKKIKR